MGPHQYQCDRPAPSAAKFEQALALLLDAADYAEQTNADPWDFAVEMRQLQTLGLSDNDLRYLVRLECVHHAGEVTVAGSKGRQFLPTGDLFFTERTCFVLTPHGLSAALGRFDKTAALGSDLRTTIRIANGLEENGTFHVPAWDAQRRILTFERQIVKQFKCHAVNQETVLSAFQEEDWPARIDDPLAPVEALNVKRRLHDTIKCLNRSQSDRRIHFRGDGTGEGVVWEPPKLLNGISAHNEI